MVNPCCGSSLQRGVRIMAIIDIVIEVLSLVLYVVALLAVISNRNDRLTNIYYDSTTNDISLTMVIINIILTLMALGLAIRLLNGANRRDLKQCKIWIIISSIVLAINVIIFIVNASAGDISAYDTLPTILSTLYRLYMIWVVFAFIQELKTGVNPDFHQQGVVYYVDPQAPNNNVPFNNANGVNNPNHQHTVVYVN